METNMQNGTMAVGTSRQSFGANEVTRTAETASTAAAAQAQANVNAMYIMAERKPRDMMEVRSRLLDDCKRRRFAEEAEYTLPRGGKKIKGPSIRFAEAALRALRNVHVKTIVTYEDEVKRVGEVVAIDLEANIPLSSGFTIDKTVERRNTKDRDEVVAERLNSQGQTVYVIRATEAEVLQKQESIVSRIRRNLILQLLPGDIKDEALEACRETMRRGDAEDPKATARKLCDAFASLGVRPAQLHEYLGHPVENVTPDEAAELRGIFASIRDKESKWSDVMEAKNGTAPEDDDDAKAERSELVKRVATYRVEHPDEYKGALADAGVKGNPSAEKLPVETLRRIAELFEPGSVVESTATSPDIVDGGELDEGLDQMTGANA